MLDCVSKCCTLGKYVTTSWLSLRLAIVLLVRSYGIDTNHFYQFMLPTFMNPGKLTLHSWNALKTPLARPPSKHLFRICVDRV